LKQREKADRLQDHEALIRLDVVRQNQLQEYMKSVANESWASKNGRIHAYMSLDQNKKRPSSGAIKVAKVDTHARIGFS
jgi:hypothetical protein